MAAWQRLVLALYLVLITFTLAGAMTTLVFHICTARLAKACGSVRNYPVWGGLALAGAFVALLAHYPVAVMQMAFITIWPVDLAV